MELNLRNENIKKILIIKPRGIGDVVLSTIVLDNLLKDFPKTTIDFLTEKPSRSILEPLNEINEVLIFDRASTKNRIRLMFEIRRRKYDLVLDFFSNPSTAQVTFFSGAKFRAGFPYRGRKYAYNLYGVAERVKFHAAQLHLEFLKKIGLSHELKNFHIGLTDNDLQFAENFFRDNKLNGQETVIICPSGGWASKKCEPEKFAEIGERISDDYGAKILIVWGPGDVSDAKIIHELLGTNSVLAPATTLRQMAALMKSSAAVIANDSGPMHISVALGKPTLALHGPTNPYLQGPFGEKHEWVRNEELDCIECNLLECPRKHECFTELPVNDVLKKFESLIRKNSLSFPKSPKDKH